MMPPAVPSVARARVRASSRAACVARSVLVGAHFCLAPLEMGCEAPRDRGEAAPQSVRRNRLASVFQKLEVSTRAELAALVASGQR